MATLAAMRRFLVLAIVIAAWAAPAHAGGPAMIVGAAEDAVQADNVPAAKAKLDLLKLAGFGAVRINEVWSPGLRAPTAVEQQRLAAVTGAAKLDGFKVYVARAETPATRRRPQRRRPRRVRRFTAAIVAALPAARRVIVGNEPNQNRFWLPQFALDGSDAAPPAYEALLAATYDALKAVSPAMHVIGGALSPRGGRQAGTGQRHALARRPSSTISAPPTGRAAATTPIMDASPSTPTRTTRATPSFPIRARRPSPSPTTASS